MSPKIGVYVCHCGSNIAGTVDVKSVVQYASGLEDVIVSKDYKYMCSEPGQEMISKDIREHGLDRVVVASCSPRMHELTFRRACKTGGINQYLFDMANIREHCAWVTEDKHLATAKAKALVHAAVNRARFLEPLETKEVDIHPDTVIIGAGITGIQAALEIADSGKKVYLVEKEPAIGGFMATFDKTFPTLDCAACILTPKMVQVAQHPNIEIIPYSEVEEVTGYIGNFNVKIRKKPRYVDIEKCTGCGSCWEVCPAARTPTKKVIKIGDKIVGRSS